jgi:alcohol dehydrogenase
LPSTVGRDFSGIVVDIGDSVTNFKIGDEFYGNATGGSLQEYNEVNHNHIAHKPSTLSFTESAAIGLAGCTSLQSLLFF